MNCLCIEKSFFCGFKVEKKIIGDQNAGRGDRIAEACRSFCKSEGSEVIFAGLMAPLHPLPSLHMHSKLV